MELWQIFEKLCVAYEYVPDDDAREALNLQFARLPRGAHFGNGCTVRNLFEQILGRQALRLAATSDPTKEELCQLIADDCQVPGLHESQPEDPRSTGQYL